MNTVTRVILSIAAIGIYGWVNFLINPVATVASGTLAGNQLENSNSAYVSTMWGLSFLSGFALLPFLVLLIVLVCLWYKPARVLIKELSALALIVALFSLPSPAFAYFATSEVTEAYTILPNESAFWIPDVGANKDSQGKMDSADYLNANKVAVKRFVIPHAKLPNTGGWNGFDDYVPTGRLIIVDRTPYSREWTSAGRGTEKGTDQSFPCQSNEGLNITAEVTVAAEVTEDNAATFLYHFGVKPPAGNRNDPQVIFTSVYYGRSLADIMDSVVRNKVQGLVCDQFATRSLDEGNKNMGAIMASVQKDAAAYLAADGITLDFMGWAGTLSFDHDVQMAINAKYDADKVQPVLGVLQIKALIDAIGKWNGQLPSAISGFWFIPTDLWGAVTGWFGRADVAQAATRKQ